MTTNEQKQKRREWLEEQGYTKSQIDDILDLEDRSDYDDLFF